MIIIKDLLQIIFQYLSWKKYYQLCITYDIPFRFSQLGEYPTVREICECKEVECTELIMHLMDKNVKYINCMNIAIMNGHLNIVKLLNEPISSSHINNAIHYNKFDIVKYLHNEHKKIRTMTWQYYSLFTTGNLEMIKYFVENIPFCITNYHNYKFTKELCEAGNLDAIMYMNMLTYKDDCIAYAGRHGHLHIVKYLIDVLHLDVPKGIIYQVIDESNGYQILDVIKYFISLGYKCTHQSVERSLYEKNFEVFEFLINEYGLKIPEYVETYLSSRNTYLQEKQTIIQFVKYLHDRGYKLDISRISHFAYRYDLETTKFIHSMGFLNLTEALDVAIQYRNEKVLYYLYSSFAIDHKEMWESVKKVINWTDSLKLVKLIYKQGGLIDRSDIDSKNPKIYKFLLSIGFPFTHNMLTNAIEINATTLIKKYPPIIKIGHNELSMIFYCNNIELLKYFYEIDKTIFDKSYYEHLIRNSSLETIQFVIDHTHTDERYNIIGINDVKITKFLYENKLFRCDIDEYNIEQVNSETMKFLFEKKLITQKQLFNVFTHAVRNEKLELVKYIIDAGIKITYRRKRQIYKTKNPWMIDLIHESQTLSSYKTVKRQRKAISFFIR